MMETNLENSASLSSENPQPFVATPDQNTEKNTALMPTAAVDSKPRLLIIVDENWW